MKVNTSNFRQKLRALSKWSVVLICLVTLALHVLSWWRLVGVFRLGFAAHLANQRVVPGSISQVVVGDGRLGILHQQNDTTDSVLHGEYTLIWEPLGYQVPWSINGPSVFEPNRILFHGLILSRYRSDLNIAIPLYMIWAPTLPAAIWIVVRAVRRRRRRETTGFSPIMPIRE